MRLCNNANSRTRRHNIDKIIEKVQLNIAAFHNRLAFHGYFSRKHILMTELGTSDCSLRIFPIFSPKLNEKKICRKDIFQNFKQIFKNLVIEKTTVY